MSDIVNNSRDYDFEKLAKMDSDIGCSRTESNSKVSCRKGCSKSRSREEIALVDTPISGETRKAANYCHAAANSKSSFEIRYVNSAIYTELVSEEKQDAAKSSKASVINLPDVPFRFATGIQQDGTSERAVTGQNTYRCCSTTLPDATSSFESFATRPVVSSGTTARAERRCKIDGALENPGRVCQHETVRRERYILDDRQVMRISTSSLSDPSVSDCQVLIHGPDFARRIAHSEWVRRKHKAVQHKREDEERMAKKRQEEEEKVARMKEEKVRLEKENFLKWMEGKRRQEHDRRAMFQNELELQKCLKEIEDKTAIAKALYLRQWIHKKKEEQKARHKEQESRQRKINEEREKRLEQCSKAYEKWKLSSKNRPKPATQGLLPHQKAKPAYINPIPWQPIVEIDSDEAQEDAFNDQNRNTSQLKMDGGRTAMAHQ